MSSSGDEEAVIKGDLRSLGELVQSLNARNTAINALSRNVESLIPEVRELRREVDTRPTADELTYKRRRGIAAALLFGTFIIFAHDEHIEHCSPGSQANAVLEYLIQHPGRKLTPHKFEQVVEDAQPTYECDLTFPLHAHGVRRNPADLHRIFGHEYTDANTAGALLYLLVGGILYLWARVPRRRTSTTHRR